MSRRHVLGVLGILLLSLSSFCYGDFLITGGNAIAAYGENGAYLINNKNEMFIWNNTIQKWQMYTFQTPDIKQMDLKTTNSDLHGTDDNDKLWKWNHQYGFSSAWSKPKGETEYDWVKLNHSSDAVEGRLQGTGAWESWDAPSLEPGDPWFKYTPAGWLGSQEMKDHLLVSEKNDKHTRWERGDLSYRVALNQSDCSSPFRIYYFGLKNNEAMDRLYNSPTYAATPNVGDVFVKQISYDEDYQNLWGLDCDGVPWQWDNENQKWIKRDIRTEEGFVPEEKQPGKFDDITKLLKEQDDYYIHATYIKGDYKPVVLIFKDTYIIRLLVGERSRVTMHDISILVFEEPVRAHKYHHILLRPPQRPQKIVRIDGGKRVRENHLLERLMIQHEVVADHREVCFYPHSHIVTRR